jgi:hypothetical protein
MSVNIPWKKIKRAAPRFQLRREYADTTPDELFIWETEINIIK